MTQVPIVIVDDEEVDRMIAQKRLERSAHAALFKPVRECVAGDDFLATHFVDNNFPDEPMLVLMDVNMPGRSGFETIEEMERMIENGEAPDCAVVMMFTSSENPEDIKRAEAHAIVKDFIVKPLDEAAIEKIVSHFH